MGFLIYNGMLHRYYKEQGVTSVTISDDVTSIGYYTFLGCSSRSTEQEGEK